jgi:hypothetical protein|tara:strand:+ start:67 stop:210 length:144 start_codon:yes stop_codon:yes gene_type:complete
MVSNVTFAQEKPTAALAPMGALGELDEIEKRIIFNSLWSLTPSLEHG